MKKGNDITIISYSRGLETAIETEKILAQEKPVSVIDFDNKVVGVVKPSKVIHTVFGGKKEKS